MRKQISTYFKSSNPSISNTITTGYALGQEWYNTTTGEKFYHKTDGVWISVDTSALPVGTVTSVGLTMPSAFSVSNSPITSSGSIAVTGAGSASQYVRGDGTLASFPDVAGGGGGQVYYFNGGISQGVIGSASYYQMSVAANISTGVDFTSGTSSEVFANFITDSGKPTQETVPAGVWILQCYFSQSESTGTPEVSASVEVYDGATFYVLSSSLVEQITNGTAIDLYTFTVAVPEYTPLTPSDRIAIRFSVGNLSGTNTVSLHTQGLHFSSVQTTFTTGLASLDGLTSAAQYFQTGTTGSDFNISTSGTDTHVFNLPTADSSKRGALSSTDWSTFNGKQDALGFTPSNSIISISTVSPLSGGGNLTANRTLSISQSSASVDGYLSSTDWSTFSGKQNALGFTPSNSTITISTTSPLSGGGDLTTSRTLSMTQSSASASGYLSSTDWSTFNGKAPLASPVFTTQITSPIVNISAQTATTIASFDASKNVVSLSTATYPSLSELAYVKGVTSNIQTQLDTKATFSGTANYLIKYGTSTTQATSRIQDTGTYIGISTINPPAKDLTFVGTKTIEIGLEDYSPILEGKDLNIAAGRAVNFAYGAFSKLNFGNGGANGYGGIHILPSTNVAYIVQRYSNLQTSTYPYTSMVDTGIGMGSAESIYMTPQNNLYMTDYGNIYKRTNNTGAFVSQATFANYYAKGITSTSNGDLYYCVTGGDIYKQTNQTGTPAALGQTTRSWTGLAADASDNIYACVNGGDVYKRVGTASFVAMGYTTRGYTCITITPIGDVYLGDSSGNVWKQTLGAGAPALFAAVGLNIKGIACDSYSNLYITIGSAVAGADVYFNLNSTTGTADLQGGTLKLNAGTGKGIGDSNLDFYTGQKTTSGTDMQTATLRTRINNEGLMTLPSVTNTLINADTTGKAVVTKEWVSSLTASSFYATQSGKFQLKDGTQGSGYLLTSDTNGVATWTASQFSSASASGYLSSTDWSTFNGKQNALGFTPSNSTITISTTSPLSGGGDLTTNRTFGISQSSASASGYLSSTDWSTFNGKQNTLTLTTTGTTGSATLVGSTLNIPQYPAATTATEMVRMFHSTWNFTTLSTWRTWTRGGSVMLTGDSNQTLGTGASPSSFADSNYILVTGRTRLKKVYWSMRHSDVASQGIELYIKSFTFANATARGAETNNQVLVQQAWTGPGSSANGFKSDFTIATHSLDAITGIQIAFRQTSGTVASLQGVNLNLEFE